MEKCDQNVKNSINKQILCAWKLLHIPVSKLHHYMIQKHDNGVLYEVIGTDRNSSVSDKILKYLMSGYVKQISGRWVKFCYPIIRRLKIDITDKPIAKFLAVKYPPKRKSHCYKLEVYLETHIFIPMHITEDAFKSVPRKLSGGEGTGGMDSEDLHGWLLKLGEYSQKFRISVEYFVE